MKDLITLLRIPFSIFLLPVFLFSISQSSAIQWFPLLIIFIVLHFFIYPGSNAYNSYMDKDEESIGGVEKPPPVTRNVFYASIVLDFSGLAISLLIGWEFCLLLIPYILVSKAYSWNRTRLKKFPLTSWLLVMIFQGGYTLMMVSMVVSSKLGPDWFTTKNEIAFFLASILVGAFYPLTQIFQHSEDEKRGDLTISRLLGIRGTFLFSALLFLAGSVGFYYYFRTYGGRYDFEIFFLSLIPALIFFSWWCTHSFKDQSKANFKNAMMFNKISAPGLAVAFLIIWIIKN